MIHDITRSEMSKLYPYFFQSNRGVRLHCRGLWVIKKLKIHSVIHSIYRPINTFLALVSPFSKDAKTESSNNVE